MQDYRHIKAWQRGHALSIAIHRLARHFSRAGHGNLRSQLTKCAASMPSNIVEGCAAATKPEMARYLDISIKSGNETEYHLQVARDHDPISHAIWAKHTQETIEIRKMTYAYRKKVLESIEDD
jgi:four helix bundle protein